MKHPSFDIVTAMVTLMAAWRHGLSAWLKTRACKGIFDSKEGVYKNEMYLYTESVQLSKELYCRDWFINLE